MCRPPPVVEDILKKSEEAAKAVGDTVYDIKKNPTVAAVLPVIETAVLVTAGVPPPVASAAVAAANGASVEQIATSAAASYVGSQVGGAVGTAAANEGASRVVANAIGSAAGSAASTAVRGGSAQDILTAAAGGAAGSGVGSYAAGQGADLSAVKGIEQATGTLATTGDPTKALIAGGGAYALTEARDATKQAPAPVEDRSTTAPTAEAPLTLDQQLAELITNAPPVDRSQDVQVADAGRIGDPGSGVYYDPSRGAYVMSDVAPEPQTGLPTGEAPPISGELPPVEITPEITPDDLAIIDFINPRTGTGTPTQVAQQPPAVEPLPSTSVSTLPPVTTTAEQEVAPEDLTLVGNVSAVGGGGGGGGGQASAATGAGGASRGTLPPVTVTAEREVSPDDLAIIDLITPKGEVPTLPEVTITPGPEEPERDFDFPEPEDESATEADVTTETPEETPAEEPYKPELFITSKKSAKAFQPRTTTRLGSVTGFAPQTGLTQALTATRPAGETEGGATGKERQQVWNEASLRLKDALGL